MPDPLIELVNLAVAGDQAATTELVSRIRPWTLKKAQEYEQKFANILPADDYISAASAKLPAILSSYKPRRGASFMGYYCACASRAMLDEYRKRQRDVTLIEQRHVHTPPADAYNDEHHHESDTASLETAMTWLTPIEREVLRTLGGAKPRTKPISSLASFLQIPESEAQSLFDSLREKAARHIDRGTGRGRMPDAITKACIKIAIQRRAQGRQWREIAIEIKATYGRCYSPKSLKEMTSRARCQSM